MYIETYRNHVFLSADSTNAFRSWLFRCAPLRLHNPPFTRSPACPSTRRNQGFPRDPGNFPWKPQKDAYETRYFDAVMFPEFPATGPRFFDGRCCRAE